MERQNDRRSLLMLTTSMVIYGTIGIFRRSIPLSSGLLACVRGFLGSAFLAAFVKLRGGTIRHGIPRKEVMRLILSGAMIGVNWIFLFEAFNYTTVATATLCYYMQPTIVILLSPLLLNEKLTGKKLLCAAAAIAGMVLVTGLPEASSASAFSASDNLKGILLGLGAAALYAAVIIVNKKGAPVDAYEKTILQLFSAAAVLVPYLLVTENFSALQLTGRGRLQIDSIPGEGTTVTILLSGENAHDQDGNPVGAGSTGEETGKVHNPEGNPVGAGSSGEGEGKRT